MKYRARLRNLLVLPCFMLIAGCLGSLVGGGQPDALYRFGSLDGVPVQATLPQPARSLLVMPVRFQAAAAGDRVLTTQGTDVAYVKDVRWMSAAPVLFREALTEAIRRRAPDVGIADRATAANADGMLSVAVDQFEVSYDHGAGAAPTIHVVGSATLSARTGRSTMARRAFRQSVSASANTTGAIVRAVDLATRQSLIEIVDWTNVTLPVDAGRVQGGVAADGRYPSTAVQRRRR